jgi:hypothetical protein
VQGPSKEKDGGPVEQGGSFILEVLHSDFVERSDLFVAKRAPIFLVLSAIGASGRESRIIPFDCRHLTSKENYLNELKELPNRLK